MTSQPQAPAFSDHLRQLLLSTRAQTRDAVIQKSVDCARRAVVGTRPPLHVNQSSASFSGSSRVAVAFPQVSHHRQVELITDASAVTRKKKPLSTKRSNIIPSKSNDDCCPICLQAILDTARTRCGHAFCFLCLFHADVASCPMCRTPISVERGDYDLDAFADLCVKIRFPSELQRRRDATRRFTEKFGSPKEILANCASHIAANPDARLPDDRLVSEVKFRSRVTAMSESKSQDHCVAAQQMTFFGGFMRRRAPSIVIVSSGESPRALEQDRSMFGTSPRFRNGISGMVVRSSMSSSRYQHDGPYTVDLDDDQTGRHGSTPRRGGASDEDDMFSSPRLAKLGLLKQQPIRDSSSKLPRLQSADTRLNQEMRLLIKRQSMAASAKGTCR